MHGALTDVLTPTQWPTLAFVLTRVGGFMLGAPMWSMNGLPRRVRAAITVVLSAALLPLATPVVVPDPLVLLPLALGMEMLVGLVIGLSAAVLVHAAAMAGEIAAMQMGLSLGSTVSPFLDNLVPGVGQLKSLLALLLYLALDGHLALFQGLARSLEVIPPGTNLEPATWPLLGADLMQTFYVSAIRIAAPVMASLLLVNIAVGLASRVVPQVSAILVLFPASIGVGFLMIGVSLPSTASLLGSWMNALPERVEELLLVLRPGS